MIIQRMMKIMIVIVIIVMIMMIENCSSMQITNRRHHLTMDMAPYKKARSQNVPGYYYYHHDYQHYYHYNN